MLCTACRRYELAAALQQAHVRLEGAPSAFFDFLARRSHVLMPGGWQGGACSVSVGRLAGAAAI